MRYGLTDKSLRADREARTVGYRGDAPIKLRAQSFQVFETLARFYPHSAPKDAIFEEVWSGRIASDDSLVKSIGDIRKALVDEDHEIIQTLPHIGYRLTRPVAFLDETLSREPSAKSAAPAKHGSIGIEGFRCLSDEPQLENLARGLTNDIVVRMAQSDAIRVLSPMLVPQGANARDTFESFGATYLVAGVVQGSGDRIRVSASLTEVDHGTVIWAREWNEQTSNYFDLQEVVLRDLISQLANRWSGVIVELEVAKTRKRPTESLEAYQHFQRGSHVLMGFTESAIKEAEGHIQSALAADPSYGEAWASLSVIYAVMSSAVGGEEVLAARHARYECAEAAIKYAPQNSWSLLVASWIAAADGDGELAKAKIRKAIVASANNPDILAGATIHAALNTDMYAEAESYTHMALDLHATPPPWYFAALGMAQFFREKDADLIKTFKSGPQTYSELMAFRAAAYCRMGQTQKALEQVEHLLSVHPQFSVENYLASEAFCDSKKKHMVETWFQAAGIPKK